RFAYVTNNSANSVSVIDTAAQMAIATVTVGEGPLGVALTPDGRFAYVANRQRFNVLAPGDVSVIDTRTRALVATIPVGNNPTAIAIAPSASSGCTGDCNDDGTVSVDELLKGVNIALGNLSLSACAAFDADGNATITVNELIAAVANALGGCPPR